MARDIPARDRSPLSPDRPAAQTGGQGQSDAEEGLAPVTVAICTRNRPRLLLDAINSVLDGTVLPAEIIVVDQSDEPNIFLAEQSLGDYRTLRYLWHPATGVSRARNKAIERATHELIALIDDDIIVSRRWLAELTRVSLGPGQDAAISGRVLEILTASETHAPSIKADETSAIFEGDVQQDVLYTGNMLLPRSIYRCVGPFDERLGPGTPFPAAEDNDFGHRVLSAGYRILYAPEALAYHQAWRPIEDYVPLQWRYGCGQGAFYAKYFSLRRRHTLYRMGGDLILYGYKAVRRLRQDRRRASGNGAFAVGLIYGAVRWILTQHRAQYEFK